MSLLTLSLKRGRAWAGSKDFFLSVLNSTSTKREAKSYLSRFTPFKKRKPDPTQGAPRHTQELNPSYYDSARVNRPGVNLGSFYVPSTAIDQIPVFSQQPRKDSATTDIAEPLHIALVKIRAPQSLDDTTLQGIGHTLSQLGRLGLRSAVVIDCDNRLEVGSAQQGRDDRRHLATEQADRVVAAIESNGGAPARRLDNSIELAPLHDRLIPTVSIRGEARVTFRKLLLAPLRRGVIPVILPVGYTSGSQEAIAVCPDDVVLALTREFAGIQTTSLPHEDISIVAQRIESLQKQISVDKLIILDPLGGIPSTDRRNRAHVFINMEQEFDEIKQELLGNDPKKIDQVDQQIESPKIDSLLSELGASNPFTRFAETELVSIPTATSNNQLSNNSSLPPTIKLHLRNLQLIQRNLALLPPTSSALLTTPEEAANSGRPLATSYQTPGVGTRRQRNPLIHNLLTDKPAISSSLPLGRLGSHPNTDPTSNQSPVVPTTFAKRGMPVTILPDPRVNAWRSPAPSDRRLKLSDARIDLPRLIHLIEDSFNRKIDIEHYLNRVNDRLAGVIIAGEYEGGALLTWETPPGVPDDGSELSRRRMVPYLDKFAVLKRSQGAGGVADIVFKAMVRDCFPEGVAWRSRRDNPVNKWYFERARGTWKLPNTNWTMFWTTEGLVQDQQRYLDYEGVCRAVEPSWADNKAVVD
ncbi:MAG: Amino-acid acetyltransferase, mitochondrial [Pycnora praestabilis]|nr:MAG: Amino-acid acetyltransferase, mitochondrial [Pycnora praestabilis]